MAIHSSSLTWQIAWTEEPDGLQFMESQRGGYDWASDTFTSLSILNCIPHIYTSLVYGSSVYFHSFTVMNIAAMNVCM